VRRFRLANPHPAYTHTKKEPQPQGNKRKTKAWLATGKNNQQANNLTNFCSSEATSIKSALIKCSLFALQSI
jgi:hypothetical protein